MKTLFHRAQERGYAKYDWLTTQYSFSFASYYDPERMGFGALRVLNDDTIAPGTGFGKHPHDNMEIITIPLSGALRHEDSMGNSAVVSAGEVQVMSAGTGVEHAEWNASDTEEVSLLQIWIMADRKNVVPRYDQKRFEISRDKNVFQQVVGTLEEPHVLGIYQDAKISLGRFDVGQEISYTLKSPRHGVYCFVIDGEILLGEHQLGRCDAVGIEGRDEVKGTVKKDAFVLVIEVPLK